MNVLKLNLGAGDHPLEGYKNLDGNMGDFIHPLSVEKETCD